MDDFRLRHEVGGSDRGPIEAILRSSGTFREGEVAVALEILAESLAPRPDTDYLWVVAEREGGILGFACFGPVPMTVGTFDLYWIAVAPGARGSGVATRLDDAVADRVRERGGRWILAETSSAPAFEAARRFYRSRGYSRIERFPDYYRDGDDRLTFGKRLRTGRGAEAG